MHRKERKAWQCVCGVTHPTKQTQMVHPWHSQLGGHSPTLRVPPVGRALLVATSLSDLDFLVRVHHRRPVQLWLWRNRGVWRRRRTVALSRSSGAALKSAGRRFRLLTAGCRWCQGASGNGACRHIKKRILDRHTISEARLKPDTPSRARGGSGSSQATLQVAGWISRSWSGSTRFRCAGHPRADGGSRTPAAGAAAAAAWSPSASTSTAATAKARVTGVAAAANRPATCWR